MLKFVVAVMNTGDLFSPERFQLIEDYITHKNVPKDILYISMNILYMYYISNNTVNTLFFIRKTEPQ